MTYRLRSAAMAVALFTALAVMVLWVQNQRLQAQLEEQVLSRAEVRGQQLSDAMAGQVEALLSVLDLAMLDLRHQWVTHPERFPEAEQRVLQSLPPGLASHLTIYDATGTVVHNSLGVATGARVSDRSYFKAMQSGEDRLVVGEPVISRQNGRWLFVVGRPVFREGRFAGGLHLAVSTDYLAGLLGRVVLSPDDRVALLTSGGAFVARSQGNEGAMGQSLPEDRPFLRDPTATRGYYRSNSPLDGASRIVGWQRLPHTGMVMLVGLSQASVLAPLEGARRQSLWVNAAVSLALVAVGGWIGHLLRKIERNRDELATSEQRLKLAQQVARLGHWEYQPDTRHMFWSEEVFRILGQNASTGGASFGAYWQLVPADEKGRLKALFDGALANTLDLDAVHRVVRPDGAERSVRLLCKRRMDERGISFHGTLQDVTELSEAQAALQRLNAELDQRVKSRTRALVALNRDLESFTYSVSHDLRTPLRNVHGFASLLEESDADRLSEAGRDALRRIRDGARRMGLLINDLLSMAQHSRAELKAQRVNLSELAQTVAGELERGDPGRRVTWRIEPALWVQADPGLMMAVLQNLLGNAWKYTGRVEAAQIELRGAGQSDGQLHFCVQDNGAGFDMRFVEQLFQPFKRLHRQEEFEGSGIGLAIVQRIVQRHGGSVRAEGGVGQGATFWFSLPVEPLRQFNDSSPDGQ